MKLYEKLRAEFGEGDRMKNMGLTTPDFVTRYDDILYDTKDEAWNRLDVYCPKHDGGLLPVLVHIHGGGWVYGSKEGYQFYCMNLSVYGFVVVNFSYRLAPENPVTAELEDINSVIRWVRAHHGEYGMDADQQRDNELMKEVFHKDELDDCLDILNPIVSVTEKFPPVSLITAEDDFLRYQSPLLKAKLDAYGVPCDLQDCVGKTKRLWHDFHTHPTEEESHPVNRRQCEFLLKF